MAVQIRLMRIGDYSGAYSLWKCLPGMGLSRADEFENIKIFLRKNPKTCFIAEEHDRLIGTVLGGSDGRRGYIYHLAVHPEFQRRGIGKQLIQNCLEAFRNQDIMKCHIFVISSNREGIKFWKKIGWVMRDDILVMSREL